MDVQATVETKDEWTKTVKVTIPPEAVDSAFDVVTKKYQGDAKVPGFRPGKAPLKMIGERYADAIRQDVIEEVVPNALHAAMHKLELKPLGFPTLSNLSAIARGAEMSFQADVEIRPEFTVTGYKSLPVKKQVYAVTDIDVTRAVDNLRDEKATTTEVQRPAQEGDVVVCNLQKIHDKLGKLTRSEFDGVTLELKDGRCRPEFLQGLVGMTVGEGKEIEITYAAEESDPELAGNTVRYRVWMKTVSQKQLPEANDDFAKSLTEGKIDTLEKFKEMLHLDLSRRSEEMSRHDLRGQIRKGVVEANPIPVPASFLDRYLSDISGRLKAQNPDVTPEAIKAQFEPMAIEQFRWDLILFEIARLENITVDDSEVSEILDGWPKDAKDKPEVERVQSTLLENKVYDAVLALAEVEEVPYSPPSQIIKPGE